MMKENLAALGGTALVAIKAFALIALPALIAALIATFLLSKLVL